MDLRRSYFPSTDCYFGILFDATDPDPTSPSIKPLLPFRLIFRYRLPVVA
jgi:hypothetical protein